MLIMITIIIQEIHISNMYVHNDKKYHNESAKLKKSIDSIMKVKDSMVIMNFLLKDKLSERDSEIKIKNKRINSLTEELYEKFD